MTSVSPVLDKLFEVGSQIIIGYTTPFIISNKDFTAKEIEELRHEHNLAYKCDGTPLIANFLPDDIRPKGIPKL